MQPVDLEALKKELYRVGLKQWFTSSLVRAFEEGRKGKLRTYDEHSFELNWMRNIRDLSTSILERRYEPGSSVAFVIFDPMVREIFAAPFRDRVVHHFLYRMQGGWWDRHFIEDSYSCRVGKGTLYGMQRVQKMMRQASKGGTREAWVLKLDIQGYFMSLPRQKLYDKVKWGLDRQFSGYEDDPLMKQVKSICDYLWEKVLMDDPTLKAHKRGATWHWNPDVLPMNKSLYTQPEGRGLPIGNVTSQLASNIYLDAFDRFLRYELGYNWTGRYVDDFVAVVEAERKEKLIADIEKMRKFLKEELSLILHPKKVYLQEVNKGVSFIGARIYPKSVFPSDRLQAKFPRSLRELIEGEGDLDSVISYLGLMRHMDVDKYVQKVFGEMGQ